MDERQRIEIGQRIRDLRENSQHTNRSIADAANVTSDAVKHWISGRTAPTYDHAREVAALFHVDVVWLWHGDEGPNKLSAPMDAADIKAIRLAVDAIMERLGIEAPTEDDPLASEPELDELDDEPGHNGPQSETGTP